MFRTMKMPRINRLSTTAKLKCSVNYPSAKKGNLLAAFRTVDSINIDYNRFKRFSGYVCPVQKQTGNAIPLALALRIAQNSNLKVCDSVYLENSMTGNSMVERMFFKPSYSGNITPGKYIIVDDVYTTGITVKALKDYIESTGSRVNSIYTLGSSKYGLEFEATSIPLKILKSKFPTIEHYFDLSELTAAQVNYLLRFNSIQRFLQFTNEFRHELSYVS